MIVNPGLGGGEKAKTAYQYAVDGGYTGTEEEFQKLMGTGPWLPVSGGTMEGDIVLPTYKNLKASDAKSVPSVFISGGKPVFGFFIDSNLADSMCVRLQGIADPKYDHDAAPKSYVDSKASGVPSGVIVMWSGAANSIPSGWLLCNGQNGTPDLRDRFIVGAGNSYGVGTTGGSAQVTLTESQMPSHRHGYNIISNYGPGGGGQHFVPDIYEENPERINYTRYTGGNQPHENRPPYYALCFIMKQ